jgi:RNA polymerase sigma-70 factor (ECF subfamily)
MKMINEEWSGADVDIGNIYFTSNKTAGCSRENKCLIARVIIAKHYHVELETSRKITLSEDELVRALKGQETMALKALYNMYAGSLLGVITRIVQHTEIAEDILQETFIKIWNSVDKYDSSKGRLFTWMVNIARNLSIDKLRSKDFKNAGKNQDIENNVDFVDNQKKLSLNIELLGLRDLVTGLKPELSSVLEMVYYNGLTHVEAAEALNLPLGTVKTRIRMAIVELRKQFN